MVALADKIQQTIDEIRVITPGVQALLGFQFVAVFNTAFNELPQSLKYIHVGSLFVISLSTIFLMAPASYHRIVDKGEDNEKFLSFASQMIVLAMITLALGISGDFF